MLTMPGGHTVIIMLLLMDVDLSYPAEGILVGPLPRVDHVGS